MPPTQAHCARCIVLGLLALDSHRAPQTTRAVANSESPSYSLPFGQQRILEADSADLHIRLTAWHPSKFPFQQFTFELKNKTNSVTSHFTLRSWAPEKEALQLDQVDEIHLFGNKLIILGRPAANFSQADIVELPSGKILDRFPCVNPAVSPTNQFVAFLKTFSGHPGPVSVSAQYLVYALTSGEGGHASRFWPIYPPDATTGPGTTLRTPGWNSAVHWISSERLFWLDASTLAFSDHYPGEDRLVVAQLLDALRAPVVRTQVLNAGDLLDLDRCRNHYSPEDFENISQDSSGLLRVSDIAYTPEKRGYLSLRLSPNPCLTRTQLVIPAP